MAESKSNDRIFIDKFDNFLFTIRKMIYFGDTNSAMQPKDPKHDKQRFINYFGAMSNESYYDNKSFSFSNDDKLKDEFANIYMFKSMNIAKMGDCFQLFSSLDCNEAYSGDKLLVGSARNAKNFKRRIEAKSELAESGSVIIKKGSPVHYLKNADPVDNFTEDEKDELCKKLETAWLVSTDNDELEHVVIEFKNTPSNRARVENEGRHGVITKFDDDFFTYEIDVNDHIEMINWVLNYGSSCRVREPKEFVDRIVTHLEEMAK